ncbi:MAG: hypothetical protein JWQ25_174 [Daejeonella sp.]|nr:hypothetical protein [Daejeonella sp.]
MRIAVSFYLLRIFEQFAEFLREGLNGKPTDPILIGART